MISFIWYWRRTKVYTNIAGKVVSILRTEFQLSRLKINDIVEQETNYKFPLLSVQFLLSVRYNDNDFIPLVSFLFICSDLQMFT